MNKESITEKRERIKKLDDDYQESVKGEKENREMSKDEIEELWKKYADARKKFEEDYNLYSGQVTDFQEQLRYLLDEKNKVEKKKEDKLTLAKLAQKLGINERTLGSYNAGRCAPSINTLMMICMILGLDINQASALLGSLGFTFMGTRREHYAYMYLLMKHRGKPIEECNKILTGLHIDEKYQLRPRKKIDNSTKK